MEVDGGGCRVGFQMGARRRQRNMESKGGGKGSRSDAQNRCGGGGADARWGREWKEGVGVDARGSGEKVDQVFISTLTF